jgi:hypothetical protein
MPPACCVLCRAGQPQVIIIDENRTGDVHGVHQGKTLQYTALAQAGFDLGCDVNESTPARQVEPEFFTVGFHGDLPSKEYYRA